MARLAFTALAGADIDGILLDLSTKAGHVVALKYDQLFERLYARLAEHPDKRRTLATLLARMFA